MGPKTAALAYRHRIQNPSAPFERGARDLFEYVEINCWIPRFFCYMSKNKSVYRGFEKLILGAFNRVDRVESFPKKWDHSYLCTQKPPFLPDSDTFTPISSLFFRVSDRLNFILKWHKYFFIPTHFSELKGGCTNVFVLICLNHFLVWMHCDLDRHQALKPVLLIVFFPTCYLCHHHSLLRSLPHCLHNFPRSSLQPALESLTIVKPHVVWSYADFQCGTI